MPTYLIYSFIGVFVITMISFLTIKDWPEKTIYQIFPHKVYVNYKLYFKDRVAENTFVYRIYGKYEKEDIVRIIFKRTPQKYLDNLLHMELKYGERGCVWN